MDAVSSGLVSDRFAVGGLLGSGGSASVYGADDVLTGQSVALKVLHPHLSRSVAAREAFFAEAAAASGLRHPNIVAVLGFGVHDADGDALAWIALELAPGVPLAEHVEQHGHLDVPSALAVADGVLRALEAAHGRGVMHRDISAANVMVAFDADGTLDADGVRLVDFGLADAAGRPALGSDILRSDPSGAASVVGVLGSANFMSPEQALGRAVDERGDVYQVGALLYFALTAHPPFVRPTVTGVMRAHVSAPPPVPSVLRRSIPRQLDRVVVRALLKNPAARFGSAAEMRQEVLAIASRRAMVSPGHSPTIRLAPSTAPSTASSSSTSVSLSAEHPTVAPRARNTVRGGVLAVVVLTVTVIAVAWVLTVGTGSTTPRADALPGAGSLSTEAAPGQADTSTEPSAEQASAPATPSASPSSAPVARTSAAVPALPGLVLAEAQKRLLDLGLTPGILSSVPSSMPSGTVLSSLPAAGAEVAPGSVVDLAVASGSNVVPAVTGLAENDAVGVMQTAGFAVIVSHRSDSRTAPGLVIAADPPATTVLPLGSAVSLVVAQRPPAGTATPAPTGAPVTPVPTPIPTGAAK